VYFAHLSNYDGKIPVTGVMDLTKSNSAATLISCSFRCHYDTLCLSFLVLRNGSCFGMTFLMHDHIIVEESSMTVGRYFELSGTFL